MEGNGTLDQIRGGCRGGWQSLVQAPCGHALAARPVRAARPADQRHRHAGHGGQQSGAGGRSRLRSDGQQRHTAGQRQGQGEGRPAASTSPSARVCEEDAIAHHSLPGGHAQSVVLKK